MLYNAPQGRYGHCQVRITRHHNPGGGSAMSMRAMIIVFVLFVVLYATVPTLVLGTAVHCLIR